MSAVESSVRATATDTSAAGGGRRRAVGVLTMLASGSSNQAGAALGALAFPVIGPVGVVAVRQFVAAAALFALARPRFRTLERRDWWPVLGLALTLGVMNLSLYMAVDRLGLALAVALEFLGPLAVAVGSSRRVVDGLCAVVAGVGVVTLTDPRPSSDYLGIAAGLLAASAWASYILLNRHLGRRLPGLQGSSVATLVSAAAWTPLAVGWFLLHPPTPAAIGLAVACGVLSSAVPYVADMVTLRHIPAALFGTFMSVNPVLAALVGWAVLEQVLTAREWLGIGLIVAANVVVTARR